MGQLTYGLHLRVWQEPDEVAASGDGQGTG